MYMYSTCTCTLYMYLCSVINNSSCSSYIGDTKFSQLTHLHLKYDKHLIKTLFTSMVTYMYMYTCTCTCVHCACFNLKIKNGKPDLIKWDLSQKYDDIIKMLG